MKRYFKALYKRIIRVFWFFFYLLPVRNNKVVVSSYYGNSYGDNLRYIVDELLKQDKNLKIYWLVKNKNVALSLPAGVIPVKNFTIRAIFHLTTAKIWLDNCRKDYCIKKKCQFYIQTWHGFALKRIEKDVENNLTKRYVNSAKMDSKAIDLIVSEASHMTKIYKNSFWYDGEVKELGSPRNDIIIKGDDGLLKEKVYNFFKLDQTKKIILYAPTFRSDHNTDCYKLDYLKVLEACKERFDGDFIFLVRLHPNIESKSEGVCEYNDKILNATYYPDLQELLVVSDIVITDYSSLMFDFMLSKKPCFQFATDIEAYKKDRNFYMPIESLPFPLAMSNNEMINNIKTFDKEIYLKDLNTFFDE